jgi:hypothetical protein
MKCEFNVCSSGAMLQEIRATNLAYPAGIQLHLGNFN